MKRFLASVILALSLACVTPHPIPTPQPVPEPMARVAIAIQPPLGGIHFTLGGTQCDSLDNGIAVCDPVKSGDYFIKLDLPSDSYEPDTGGIYSIHPGDACPGWPNCELLIKIVKKLPPTPSVGSGRVTPDGPRFALNGQTWQWRGATDFMLFRDYLDGKNIDAVLLERVNSGANILRVLGMAHYIPINAGQLAFSPANYANYLPRLIDFVHYVNSFGMRVEFTALADAQILMPKTDDQRRFVQGVLDAVAQIGRNANRLETPGSQWAMAGRFQQGGTVQGPVSNFVEIGNELWKNGVDILPLMKSLIFPEGVLVATGNYDWDNPIVAQYVTVHESRDDEWPRKSRLDDWYGLVHVPAVWDEPIGADETNQPGKRSNVEADFYDLCAGTAMHGAGLTFHSTAGILSQLWGPVQGQIAKTCFDVMKQIPLEAPIWQYSRGGLSYNPLVHDDALALRTFCQIGPGKAVCEVVRPQAGWTAAGQDGWRIVSQQGPNGRLIFLEK